VYCLSRAANNTLELWRVQTPKHVAGRLIGRYQGRSDATKAIG
jgi:hypothetical protein